jgi:hypothetical protein
MEDDRYRRQTKEAGKDFEYTDYKEKEGFS